MIQGAKGHAFHACMKRMTLRPEKHEKAARLGRISNVLELREHKVRSNSCVSGRGQNTFCPLPIS